MEIKPTPLFDFVKCLSQAVDLISPSVANHHNRAAQVALSIGREMDLPDRDLKDLVIAAALHDVGGLTRSERLGSLDFEYQDPYGHAVMSYLLLKPFKPFRRVATIVRYHHVPWDDGNCRKFDPAVIPESSFILQLADKIAVLIEPRDEIMGQVPEILDKLEQISGSLLMPEHVKLVKDLSKNEAFWFNAVQLTELDHLDRHLKFESLTLEEEDLLGLVNVFRRIIDFRSPFTAAHSMGVATTAEAIAKTMSFTELDVRQIYLAGLLHDIGKLAIPTEILEKPGRLTESEFNVMKSHSYYTNYLLQPLRILDNVRDWGSNHHERMDGGGYPYHKNSGDISLGARVVAVADVYTALTEDRPYRSGMSRQTAFEIINGMAKEGRLDTEVVAKLQEHLREIDDARSKSQKLAREEYESMMQDRELLKIKEK